MPAKAFPTSIIGKLCRPVDSKWQAHGRGILPPLAPNLGEPGKLEDTFATHLTLADPPYKPDALAKDQHVIRCVFPSLAHQACKRQ